MSCEATIDQHIYELIVVMAELGMGGGCETAYHAMCEVTEAIRLANNYLPYAPTKAVGLVEKMLNDSSGEINIPWD